MASSNNGYINEAGVSSLYESSDYSIGNKSMSYLSSGDGYSPRTVPLQNDFTETLISHNENMRTSSVTSSRKSTLPPLSVISEGAGHSPIYTAIFNMLAGCGIVGLPVTYKNSGLALGITLMIFVAIISVYTLRLLVKVGKKVDVEDYERLMEKCFGVKGYYFLAVTILLFDIGACLTYSIILGDSAHAVMSHLFGWDNPDDRKLVILGAYILLILPFCLGKNHAFIEKISACAIGSVIIMIAVVMYYYFDQYQHENVSGVKYFNDNSQQLLSALGTISFAFVQHDQTFLVYKTLYNNTLRRYTILSSWALGIQSLLCISIGLFGYMSFGADTNDDVLQNYDIDDSLVIGIRIMYTLTMAFIFPTAFYVVRHITYCLIWAHLEETFADANSCKRTWFTMVCWGFFLVLALFIDDLGFVMSLSGLICALLVAFILPCLCNIATSEYPLLFWRAGYGKRCEAFWEIVPSLFLIVFGTGAGVIGTVQLFIQQF